MSRAPEIDPEIKRHMRRALRLAHRGLGKSSPNPAVGAVVVKTGKVVGEGFHAKAGEPHAEVHALNMAGKRAKGADIYVTLEPCHHAGRTPPCTRAIMRAGIKRVFYGASDPNPKVAGGGGAYLAGQGLTVTGGVLEEACAFEHRFFFTHITKNRPHVVLKTAATADGKTAAHTGDSRWVTGEASRRLVHRLRGELDAVGVGIGTALADDPQLTCRLRGGRDPLRVIVDSGLRLPPTAKVLDKIAGAGCVVACGPRPPAARARALVQAGAEVLKLPRDKYGVSLPALLEALANRGMTSLLLEGGAGLAWGFLAQGLVDEVMYFYAPKLIGGNEAPSMIGGQGLAKMAQAVRLDRPKIRRLGDDVLMWARVLGPNEPKT